MSTQSTGSTTSTLTCICLICKHEEPAESNCWLDHDAKRGNAVCRACSPYVATAVLREWNGSLSAADRAANIIVFARTLRATLPEDHYVIKIAGISA